MDDVTKTPYAGFLEMLCKNVVELKPEKMAVLGLMEDGTSFTATYGDCGPFDMVAMAAHMQADAMMEIVKANARDVIEAAEEEEDEDGC